MESNSFWFDYNLVNFLFAGLNTNSLYGLLVLCLVIVALTVLYEWLKVCLAQLKLFSTQHKPLVSSCTKDNDQLIENEQPTRPYCTSASRMSWFAGEVAVYVVELTLGYLLMLSVMTFNGFVGLAVILGAGLGYLVFGLTLMAINIQTTQLRVPCYHCIPRTRGSTLSMSSTTDGGDGSTSLAGDRDASCCQRIEDPSSSVQAVVHC